MRALLLSAAFVAGCAWPLCHAQAQQINGYRYWFNDDMATTTVVTLPATGTVDSELVLNSATLPPGQHLATIQFRDTDGRWGAPWTSLFVQRGSTITAVQHWFNDDPSGAISTSVTPASAPPISVPLDADALPVGLHTITLRTRDEQGGWSVPYTTHFARIGGMITGYEYWIDEAIDESTTGSVPPAGTVELITSLPVPTTDGEHLFTIRFRDNDGGWTVPLSSTFTFAVGIDELPGLKNYLLFPNPVDASMSLRVEATDAHRTEISVLDATGRTVLALGAWQVHGLAQRTWDLSALPAGSYHLRITNAGRAITLPFIKH